MDAQCYKPHTWLHTVQALFVMASNEALQREPTLLKTPTDG